MDIPHCTAIQRPAITTPCVVAPKRSCHRVHPRCSTNELCTLKHGHPMSRFGPVTGKHDTRHANRPRGETTILSS
ncbi:hypothetical protein LCP9604111_358 [Penicillium roqueforti]|uniref:uncharacterized protein n=1 Tax=Penicillium roqueforti TaxID=5082 RepID=UPI00190E036E|nr:uncharacterized protein LCP9604111_358 [Penicillium roqueforti]KAF9252832.1 hypothetical protein LCP9604111_358 [Penicillium roqueforti]